MALTAERIDELLTSFVVENDADLAKASQENPQIYEVVMGALGVLSNQFGKGQVTLPTPSAEPEPVVDVSPAIKPADEKVDEIKEELTMDELKEAIKTLKPLAEFDDEVKQELDSLKARLNALKKKKS